MGVTLSLTLKAAWALALLASSASADRARLAFVAGSAHRPTPSLVPVVSRESKQHAPNGHRLFAECESNAHSRLQRMRLYDVPIRKSWMPVRNSWSLRSVETLDNVRTLNQNEEKVAAKTFKLEPNSSENKPKELPPQIAPLAQLVRLPDDYNLVTPETCKLPPLKKGQRMVCIGDVHGDFRAFKEFLTIAGVYEEDPSDMYGGKWIGGNSVLVQLGDILDRGMQELVCYKLICNLSRQAAEEGGAVVVLYGNHEAMNAAALFQYASGEYEYEYRVGRPVDDALGTKAWRLQYGNSQPSRWATYEPGGLLAVPLLSKFKVAVQVGRTVCVHAGLTKKHLDDNPSKNPKASRLDGMSEAARKWILKDGLNATNVQNNFGMYGNSRQAIIAADYRFNVSMATMPDCIGGSVDSQNSPVWMRNYSSPANRPVTNEYSKASLREVLNELDADRMVVGHTVQQKINGAAPNDGGDSQIWRIDVGASRGVMGQAPEVLQISVGEDGVTEVVTILTRNGPVPADRRSIRSTILSDMNPWL